MEYKTCRSSQLYLYGKFQNPLRKICDITFIAGFLLLIVSLWMGIFVVPGAEVAALNPVNGYRDLSSFDFTGTLCRVNDRWENYPEKLYAPRDFAYGAIPGPEYLSDAELRQVQYATHRLSLKLPPGAVYAMSLKSADYAMRIYIDGKEVDSVGTPGASRETTIPRTGERTYTFYTASGDVRLVVQTANFVHKDSGTPPVFILGLPQNIQILQQRSDFTGALIIGGLLITCIYHLALYLLNRRRIVVLLYAACCLLFIFLTNKIIPMAWPDYNWFFALRFEYIVHYLTFGMVTLFLYALYPKLLHKAVMRCYWGVSALYIFITLLLDSTVYTRLLIGFDVVSGVVTLYVVVRLAMQVRGGRLRHFLSFVGMFVLFLFGVNDVLYHNNIVFIGPVAGQVFTAPVGMLFFVICYALTLSAELRDSEEAMERARLEISEAEARYNALVKQQETGNAAPVPSDFGLSAREADVLWLLISGKGRKGVSDLLGISMGTVNTHCSRIYKKTHCEGLAELIRLFGIPGNGANKP